jgi:hypothetical protein
MNNGIWHYDNNYNDTQYNGTWHNGIWQNCTQHNNSWHYGIIAHGMMVLGIMTLGIRTLDTMRFGITTLATATIRKSIKMQLSVLLFCVLNFFTVWPMLLC